MGTEIRTVNQTLATCLLCPGEVFRAESRRLFSISSGGAGIAPCSPLLLHFQVGHAPVGCFPLLVYLTTCLIRDNWQLLHLTHELCEINILHTATLVSFQNLKYHQWWCYHICMLRTNSSRGNFHCIPQAMAVICRISLQSAAFPSMSVPLTQQIVIWCQKH